MKVVVALLCLVLFAVCASEHTLSQPAYPCGYQCKVTMKSKSEKQTIDLRVNGRYKFVKMDTKEQKVTYLIRPDINKKEKDTELLAVFVLSDKVCEMEYLAGPVSAIGLKLEDLTQRLVNRSYAHKESKKFDDKKCTCYYNGKSPDDDAVYVYEDYVYSVVSDGTQTIFDCEWKAPMKVFALDDDEYPRCKSVEEKVYETPSDDFVFCTATTIQVAFFALLSCLVFVLAF